MYIDRPQLLEKIKMSILKYKVTYIYGMHGVGKTTICYQCIQKYFNNEEIHTLNVYSNIRILETYTFDNGIYVFEEFDPLYIDTYIIDYIYKITLTSKAKFIFISTKRNLGMKEHIFDYVKSFFNFIEIKPFTYNEMEKFFGDLYNNKIIEKIFNATNGNILLAHEISHILSQQKIFSDNLDIIYKPCIIDIYGKPIEKINNSIKIAVTEVNDQLLYKLSQNPNLLYNLSSYDFERVIAKMFEKKGFSVKITPQTRDGGKDIFVAKNDLCSFLFYVECKQYAPDKPVGIDVIQRLYGVISAEKATGGIIATTSCFAKPAKDYIKKYQLEHQLTLQDYDTISDILKSLQYNTQ